MLDSTQHRHGPDESSRYARAAGSQASSHVSAQRVVDSHYTLNRSTATRARQNLRSQESLRVRLEERKRSLSIKRQTEHSPAVLRRQER